MYAPGGIEKNTPGGIAQGETRGGRQPHGEYSGGKIHGAEHAEKAMTAKRMLEHIGGTDTWGGHHAGHTSVRWHGTGTAKHAPSAGYADSLSTTASQLHQLMNLGNLTMSSLSTCGLILNWILIILKPPIADAIAQEEMARTGTIVLVNRAASGDSIGGMA